MTERDYIASCLGKMCFQSPALAHKAARRRPKQETYRCKHCGYWHVGTVALRPRRARMPALGHSAMRLDNGR